MVDFLVMGNGSAVICKNVFQLIKEKKIHLGVTLFCGKMPSFFYRDGSLFQVNSIAWFTSFDARYNKFIDLKKSYIEGDYKRFDNYDAISIDNVSDIPYDYDGVMGVPVTFLDKWNPSQFEIVGFRKGLDGKDLKAEGEYKFTRILIRRKKQFS